MASSVLSEQMPPSYKGPWDYTGPTQVIQKNLFITSEKCNITYSLFPGLGRECFVGAGHAGLLSLPQATAGRQALSGILQKRLKSQGAEAHDVIRAQQWASGFTRQWWIPSQENRKQGHRRQTTVGRTGPAAQRGPLGTGHWLGRALSPRTTL